MGSSGGSCEWSNAWPCAIPGLKVAVYGANLVGRKDTGVRARAAMATIASGAGGHQATKRNAHKGLDAGRELVGAGAGPGTRSPSGIHRHPNTRRSTGWVGCRQPFLSEF